MITTGYKINDNPIHPLTLRKLCIFAIELELQTIYHQLSSFITINQIFGPYLSHKSVKFLLSITLTFCIGK